jgi:hypothetical protein
MYMGYPVLIHLSIEYNLATRIDPGMEEADLGEVQS